MRLLSGLCLLLACSNTFEKQSRISKLRILGVRAEPAELLIEEGKPPPRTTLTALAVDPSGATIQLRWALCTVQGAVPSPSIQCPGSDGIDLFSTNGSAVLDLGVEPFRTQYDRLVGGGGAPPEGVRKLLADGVPVIIGLTATTATDRLDGITTVTLRTTEHGPINHNPDLATLQADGATLAADGSSTVAGGSTVRLAPIPAEGSHELMPDGTIEKLNYSFYATGGDIQSLRSVDTTATGEAADPSIDWLAPALAGSVQLWVVVRDGRGGQGFMTRTVQVR